MIKNLNRKILLYFHTLRFLTFEQIFYKVKHTIIIRIIKHFPKKYYKHIAKRVDYQINDAFNFDLFICKNNKSEFDKIINNNFKFLNLRHNFNKQINWKNNDLCNENKLWKFNLNYQEYLVDIAILYKENGDKKYLQFIIANLKSWIKSNNFSFSYYDEDNWNAYVVSNRIINWIKIYSMIADDLPEEFKKELLFNLNFQTIYLSKNLEFHLKGNHLIENGFALLFAAYFFNDSIIYADAIKIINKEIDEQILADGGHFELSPMYHQHILFRIFDCINLLRLNNIFDSRLLNVLEAKSELMLSWLGKIIFNNEDLPQVNDSSINVYPTFKNLKDYAVKLNISSNNRELKDSGYRMIKMKKYECFIDVGKIGPDYMPGHSHSDTFSFILYVKEKPFIVDTGISTYNSSAKRLNERSTSSHNTVMLNNAEQSEVWSSFRVGRRVYPKILKDLRNEISAMYKSFNGKACHKRDFLLKEDYLIVHDFVDKNFRNTSFLHFHPDIEVLLSDNFLSTEFADIKFENFENITLDNYEFCNEFNLTSSAKRLKMNFNKQSTIKIYIK